VRFVSKFGIGILFLSLQVSAADLAILQNGFSIRHERREVIGNVTRLYPGSGDSYVDIPNEQIEHFEKDSSIRPSSASAVPVADLNDVIHSAGAKHRIDPDFISSVIHAESSFNPRAVSPKGAQGLMQLMPGTASQLGVQNPFDPNANVEGVTCENCWSVTTSMLPRLSLPTTPGHNASSSMAVSRPTLRLAPTSHA